MASPAPDQPLQDKTYLPDQDAAEIIDFLAGRIIDRKMPRLRWVGSTLTSVTPATGTTVPGTLN
jgi:hypothetical protein